MDLVIPVCTICGKVDAKKGDGHDCFQHIQNEEELELDLNGT